ncbi:MAG: SPOR domain-containing protein [Sphingomonas bacterium]|nr:SPOR domain-containing protein [Sphingomonas bacterium]
MLMIPTRAMVIPTCAIRALILIAALGAPAVPIAAQYAITPTDPGTSLAGALRTLSSEPRNFLALIAAGRASLDMGDTQAAAGFYGRAEEAAPQSPVPKVGMGAAMTAMGDARGAMTYFDRASALGAPHSLLALDRGLAFDLLGQQAKAQSDYRIAMFGAQADEARRRLALSLAISKDIKGAAAMLEPLLRRRDAAAVRTNAFVLALAGDREGARRTIEAALPGAGARFEPFFRLLPVLRADEKAMAVHLGEFPKDAAQRYSSTQRISSSPVVSIGKKSEVIFAAPRRTAQVQVTPPMNARVTPPARTEVTPGFKPDVTPVIRVAEAPRRAVREPAAPSTYLATSRPSLDPSRYASVQRKPDSAVVAAPKKAAEPDPEPRPGFSADELLPVVEEAEPLVPVNVGAVLNRDGEPILTTKPIRTVEAAAPPPRSTPKLEIKRPPAPRPKVELARLDVAKAKASAKTKTKVEAEKSKEAAKLKEAARKKTPTSPYFVQLASGANADRMGIEYKRIKAKKPALFTGKSAQVTNGKELFRLVIGPFKSRDDCGDFVNQLAKAGIDGFTYTAPNGMTFEKIATK